MLLCHGFKNDIAIVNCLHVFNMKWKKKIILEEEKWYGKQQCLPIGHKKCRAANSPPCPIGSGANGIDRD